MADGVTIETFTAGDGYRWHYRRYPTQGNTRGRVVFLHGIQSHGGWYEYSSQRLARAGFEVLFLERRGSGLNQERRGDTPSFRRLLDDVAEFLRAQPRADGVPLTLAAISWGGKIAVALQRRHPGLVDALALLCPGFCPKVGPAFFERLAIFAARLVRPTRMFPIPLSDPQLFTSTPRWLEFLRKDPLSLHSATARFLIESARLDGYLYWAPRHVRMPVLLMLAGKDRIIDNQKTRRFVARFATSQKQIIEYPDAQHTLEFEPEPDQFIDALIGWFESVHQKGRRP